MNEQGNHFLGVDVGGTHLKIGVVNRNGEVLHFFKEDTLPYREHPDGFNQCFLKVIGKYLDKFPHIKNVGIGLPGLITKDRTTPLEIPAIPNLNNFNLKHELERLYPNVTFCLENDASAAALGELKFGTSKPSPNFLFITMGTGIGSAVVLDGKIFKGGRGNAMEMGHMLSRGNEGLEKLIGRIGIIRLMERMIHAYPEDAGELVDKELGTHLLVDTARKGNAVSLMVFEEAGRIIGEAIVSTVRIMDVNEIYFGGGVSAGLEFMMPAIEKTVRQYLTKYYLHDIKMAKATLENNAGTLGAAALCFTD